MIVDTDVLIWVLRGNAKAAEAVDRISARRISIVTYMELLQGAADKREMKAIKSFLAALQFRTLPLTESVGFRALGYIEEYSLASSVNMADALIAATAIEAGEPILTGNDKHYRAIDQLEIKRFRP
ncbi:MAG: type II toxin-antitoxin system VapC family toxin [Planctomycetaceae bacterium]|nr:type II toxin-antitoxin system VapC family toxin [Planctomycetaceae bacterium]